MQKDGNFEVKISWNLQFKRQLLGETQNNQVHHQSSTSKHRQNAQVFLPRDQRFLSSEMHCLTIHLQQNNHLMQNKVVCVICVEEFQGLLNPHWKVPTNKWHDGRAIWKVTHSLQHIFIKYQLVMKVWKRFGFGFNMSNFPLNYDAFVLFSRRLNYTTSP